MGNAAVLDKQGKKKLCVEPSASMMLGATRIQPRSATSVLTTKR